jgi:hypothetical protein
VETQHYKVLFDHASKLQHAVDESSKELTTLKDELFQLRSGRKAYEDSVNVRSKVAY